MKTYETFDNTGIRQELTAALAPKRIKTPTDIQSKTIPAILAGKDIMMESQTGSGKTLAYLLPLFERLDPAFRSAQALILVPTHELALQVQKEAKYLSKEASIALNSTVIMGNVNITRQIDALKEKPQLIIGTPGRILELIKKKKIAAHTVKTIVIDEADKLLDEHNLELIRAVIKTTLRDRQLVLASASIPKKTIETAKQLSNTITLVKGADEKTPASITHGYILVEKRDKIDTLRKLLYAAKPKRAIVFTSQSDNIAVIADKLRFQKFPVSCIYGAMPKAERAKEIREFSTGKNTILLATDVAGRGLHFEGVDYVFHLNIAEQSKDYMHRAGRTGRNGISGRSIAIATAREIPFLKKYEHQLKVKITELDLMNGKIQTKNLKK